MAMAIRACALSPHLVNDSAAYKTGDLISMV